MFLLVEFPHGPFQILSSLIPRHVRKRSERSFNLFDSPVEVE